MNSFKNNTSAISQIIMCVTGMQRQFDEAMCNGTVWYMELCNPAFCLLLVAVRDDGCLECHFIFLVFFYLRQLLRLIQSYMVKCFTAKFMNWLNMFTALWNGEPKFKVVLV